MNSQEIANKTIEDEYNKLHPVKVTAGGQLNDNNDLQLKPVNNHKITKNNDAINLNSKERNYILQSSAEFISNQIQANHLKCNYSTIIWNQNKYTKEIKQLRDNWLSKLSDVPFTHKRVRLEQYQHLYANMLTTYLECIEIKDKVMVSKHLESLLDKSRLEIEGTRVNVKHDVNVTYDDQSLIETSKEIIELADYEDVTD